MTRPTTDELRKLVERLRRYDWEDAADAIEYLMQNQKEEPAPPPRSRGAEAWDEACDAKSATHWRYDAVAPVVKAIIDRLGEQLPPRPVVSGGSRLMEFVANRLLAERDGSNPHAIDYEAAARELGIGPKEQTR